MITAVFLGCATVVFAAAPGLGAEPAKPAPKPADKAADKHPAKAGERAAERGPAKADDGGARAWVDRVQRYYDQTKDYSADFTQRYTRVALSKTSEQSGRVMIKKPGMMRWEYERPAKKLFVADGAKLYVYEPEEEQVVIDSNFKTTELSSSISFLWGDGKLTDAFAATLGDPEKYQAPKGAGVLELTPKRDATYTKLVIILDPKTAQVDESILYEASGNTNRFKFRDAKVNAGLPRATFTFTPPKGVEVIQR